MSMFSGDKLLLLFGIAVGMLILWGAWYSFQESRAFLLTAASATGKVIELREETHKGSNGRVTVVYCPTIDFDTPDNRKIRFKSALSVDQHKYPVGESIGVLYDRSNPDNARIDSFASLWGGAVVLILIGIAFVGGALLVYFMLYRDT